MRVLQSRVQVDLAATTAFNPNRDFQIKGFRVLEAGDVHWTDEGGASHVVGFLPGDEPPIGGLFSIDVTNAVALLVYL